MTTQSKAFISYSHADDDYLSKLQKHLSQMKRNGELEGWSDHEIHAGSDLNSEILEALDSSKIFIALLSADYLNSSYCYEKEFQRALELRQQGKLTIVPIVCRPCDWKVSPFGDLLALPKDGQAISEWDNEDTAFYTITQGLRKLIQTKGTIADLRGEPLSGKASKSRKYQVKKDFDKIQKLEFIDNIFSQSVSELKKYLKEIANDENIKYRVIQDSTDGFQCILVNREKAIAESELEYQKGRMLLHDQFDFNKGDLNVSIKTQRQHVNKALTLNWDDYKLYLQQRNEFRDEGKTFTDPIDLADGIWRQWLELIGVSIY